MMKALTYQYLNICLIIIKFYADLTNKVCNIFSFRGAIYRFIDSKQTFIKKNYNLKHKSPLKQTVKNKELYE
jgi:hypothetical protein